MKAPEIQTDAVTEEELDDFITQSRTCNGFAFNYLKNHDNAVVKDAFIEGGSVAHCYVYDKDRDVTIDATLGQFSGKPMGGAWDGDEHPYRAQHEEVYEWTDEEAFVEHHDVPNSDFVL